jgi:uncharacterized membrane protein HdeD (DUF308 family)
MQRQFDVFVSEAPDLLAIHWGWVVALGVLIGALGILAIVRARAATVVAVGFLGVILITSAVAIFLFAIAAAGFWTDFAIHLLWAALVFVIGVMLLTRPMVGAETLALLAAFYFIVEGILILGFAYASHIDNFWIYATQGVLALMLGGFLLSGWPFTGAWLIGTLLGVDLLFKGWGLIALGLALRAISEGSLF